ncbi:MAG: TadE/TadG family type IV pilus assembly protein [Planctomycetota bacterium]
MTTPPRPHSRKRDRRRGVALAEFAVCLPVLILLVLGVIETCTVVFLKQSLSIAAYEGAHTAVQPGATAADVRSICEGILADRRVAGATVDVTPADLGGLAEGEPFTVTVSAPAAGTAQLSSALYSTTTISAAATMVQEFR